MSMTTPVNGPNMSRRTFLALPVAAATMGGPWASGHYGAFNYADHNIRVIRDAREKIDKITPSLETTDAVYYGYFESHSPDPKNHRPLSLEYVQTIHSQHPHVVYVREGLHVIEDDWESVRKSCSDQDFKILGPKEDGDWCLPFHLLNNSWLDPAAVSFLRRTEMPILSADIIIGLERKVRGDVKSRTLFTAATSVGMSLGGLLSLPLILRRQFFSGGIYFLLSCAIPFGIGRYEREYGLIVGFRNAIIALKVLQTAKMLRERTGEKPAFLLTMGTGHSGIIENLEKGWDFNLRFVRRFLEGEDFSPEEQLLLGTGVYYPDHSTAEEFNVF